MGCRSSKSAQTSGSKALPTQPAPAVPQRAATFLSADDKDFDPPTPSVTARTTTGATVLLGASEAKTKPAAALSSDVYADALSGMADDSDEETAPRSNAASAHAATSNLPKDENGDDVKGEDDKEKGDNHSGHSARSTVQRHIRHVALTPAAAGHDTPHESGAVFDLASWQVTDETRAAVISASHTATKPDSDDSVVDSVHERWANYQLLCAQLPVPPPPESHAITTRHTARWREWLAGDIGARNKHYQQRIALGAAIRNAFRLSVALRGTLHDVWCYDFTIKPKSKIAAKPATAAASSKDWAMSSSESDPWASPADPFGTAASAPASAAAVDVSANQPRDALNVADYVSSISVLSLIVEYAEEEYSNPSYDGPTHETDHVFPGPPPPTEIDARIKRMRAVHHSFWMDVKHSGCYSITTLFSHAGETSTCISCGFVLAKPDPESKRGRLLLTEGCAFRKKTYETAPAPAPAPAPDSASADEEDGDEDDDDDADADADAKDAKPSTASADN